MGMEIKKGKAEIEVEEKLRKSGSENGKCEWKLEQVEMEMHKIIAYTYMKDFKSFYSLVLYLNSHFNYFISHYDIKELKTSFWA